MEMFFSKVTLGLWWRSLPPGFQGRQQSLFKTTYSFYTKVGITLDPSADRDSCLMPWTPKQSCLEFLRPWRWYDWNRPDEDGWRRKACVGYSCRDLLLNVFYQSLSGMAKIRSIGTVVEILQLWWRVDFSQMRFVEESGHILWFRSPIAWLSHMATIPQSNWPCLCSFLGTVSCVYASQDWTGEKYWESKKLF